MIFAIIIATVAISAATSQNSSVCWYLKCISEKHVLQPEALDFDIELFNILDIQDNATDLCPEVVSAINSCRQEAANACPRVPQRPWQFRLRDDRYIMFLSAMAEFACSRLPEAILFKECMTLDLESSIKSCILVIDPFQPPKYDFDCMIDRFNQLSKCVPELEDFYIDLVNVMATNPYLRQH